MELKNKDGLTEAEFLKNYDDSMYEKPSVTVDVCLFYVDRATKTHKLLLIQRGDHPYLGKWALPGGFLDRGESLEQAAKRELKEETGIEDTELVLIGTFSNPDRDPRGWVLSSAYAAIVEEELKAQAGDDAKEAKWFDLSYGKTGGEVVFSLQHEENKLDAWVNVLSKETKHEEGLAFDHALIIATACVLLESSL